MPDSAFQSLRYPALSLLGALALAPACSGAEPPHVADLPSYGASSGWTFVPLGVAPDVGGVGGASGGLGGASSGVAGASAGASTATAGSGGDVALPPITFGCAHKVPSQPLITSFDGFMADRWHSPSPGNLDGGVYAYPDALVPTAGEFLGVDGTITTYAGMGVWFAGCIDASKFSGLRFTLSGNAGPTGAVQFYLVTNRDKDVNVDDSVGACLPTDPADPWPSCHPPGVRLEVSQTPSVQTVLWQDLADGAPTATTDGSDILSLQWSFVWSDSSSSYPANLTVDNLEFFVSDPAP